MWIQTVSGRRLDLTCPNPEEISIQDIAGGLSRVCRFSGQIREFYSVAQHSVFVAELAADDGAPLSVQLAALLHDASEAYMGDVPSPVKRMCGDYVSIESAVMEAVMARFRLENIGQAAHQLIHTLDRIALATEFRDLVIHHGKDHNSWDVLRNVEPSGKAIEPVTSIAAEGQFNRKYQSIMNQLDAGAPGMWSPYRPTEKAAHAQG